MITENAIMTYNDVVISLEIRPTVRCSHQLHSRTGSTVRISQRLSDVNYSLTRVETGEEAGVFHVANLQPFHTWATALSTKSKRQVPHTLTPDLPVSDIVPADDLFTDSDPTPPSQTTTREFDKETERNRPDSPLSTDPGPTA